MKTVNLLYYLRYHFLCLLFFFTCANLGYSENTTFDKNDKSNDLVGVDINLQMTSNIGEGNYVMSGDIVHLYFKVTNMDAVNSVTNLNVSCNISSMLTYQSYTATAGTYTNGTPGTWIVSSIAPQQSVTLDVTLQVVNNATGAIISSASLTADQTDTNTSLDDAVEKFRYNNTAEKFSVKNIYLSEDGSTICDNDSDPTNDPNFLGITINETIFEGGYLPQTLGTDRAYSIDDNVNEVLNYAYFDIPEDILPNSAEITFNGNNYLAGNLDSNAEANILESNAVFGSIKINFQDNTYSGFLYDYGDYGSSYPQGTDFAFSDLALGSPASSASNFIGRADFQDFTVSLVSNRIMIQHSGTAPVDDYSYLIEYFDGTYKSLTSVANNAVQTAYIAKGSSSNFVIDASSSPDEIVVKGAFSDSDSSNAYLEYRGIVRIVLIKQDDGTYIASGSLLYDHGNIPENTSNYTFVDYSLTNAASTAPYVSTIGLGDTTATGGFLADLKIYTSGTNIIIEQKNTLYDNSYSMFTAQLRKYVVIDGEYVGSSVAALGTTISSGDFDTTSNGGPGADFYFPVLTGSETGTINYVNHYNSGNNHNENGGMVSINIDFENDVNGNIIGVKASGFSRYVRNAGLVDLVSFNNIDLINPVQLVTDTGLATGVISNHANLTEFRDPQAGGITISYIPGAVGELDQIRVQVVENNNNFNQYIVEAANASWKGRTPIYVNNVPDYINILSGTNLGAGSYVFSPYDIYNGVDYNFSLPDNYNSDATTNGVTVTLSDDPRLMTSFKIFVVSNADPDTTACPIQINPTNPPNEGEYLSQVSSGSASNDGNTVREILSTSTITPTKIDNGIAITAFDDDTSEGQWQYSIDNGATWIDVPSDVSETNALLLGNNSKLRYVFYLEGTPTITFKAWNLNRTDKTIGQTGVDTTVIRYWEDTNGDGVKDTNYVTEFSTITDFAYITSNICYKPIATSGSFVPSINGITTLNRRTITDPQNDKQWPNKEQSGILVLDSHTKGFVITRLTTLQIEGNGTTANPGLNKVEGMLVFDTDENCLKLYNGTKWGCITQVCNN